MEQYKQEFIEFMVDNETIGVIKANFNPKRES